MSQNFSITFAVDQTPDQAFAAIQNVRGWWSGQIEGPTDQQDAEWTYTVPDIHFSKFRSTEVDPGRRVAWRVLDSHLSFTEDKQEWTGTTVAFDIIEQDGRTQVTFTTRACARTTSATTSARTRGAPTSTQACATSS